MTASVHIKLACGGLRFYRGLWSVDVTKQSWVLYVVSILCLLLFYNINIKRGNENLGPFCGGITAPKHTTEHDHGLNIAIHNRVSKLWF